MPKRLLLLVSFTDTEGIQHTAEVSASSLYEAALGVAEFKRAKLMDTQPGLATRLSVTVKSPTTRHELTMAKLQSWLEGGAKSPSEQVMKKRLRELSGTG